VQDALKLLRLGGAAAAARLERRDLLEEVRRRELLVVARNDHLSGNIRFAMWQCDVGHSCMALATATCRAMAMAPTACSVRICEASSKSTRSNSTCESRRYLREGPAPNALRQPTGRTVRRRGFDVARTVTPTTGS
jgi:hypothetical protein